MSKDDSYAPADVQALRREIERLALEVRLLKTERSPAAGEPTDIRSVRQELRRELQRVNQELSDKDARLASKDRQLSEFDEQLTRKSRDMERLVLWLEELDVGISALLNSRQWRASRAMGELRRRLSLKPKAPTAADNLNKVMKKFRSWRRSYERSEGRADDRGKTGSRRLRAPDRSEEDPPGQPSLSREGLAREVRKRIGPVQERTEWPLVSIVVLNRNGLGHLGRLFPGLQSHTDYPDFEVVLVDNGSTDGSVGFVKSFEARFPVRLIENPRNTSFSDGNNRGVEAATGELLLFLNNDIEPFEPGWLKEMVNRVEGSRASAVGALLLYPGEAGYRTDSGYAVQHRGVRFRRAKLGDVRAFNLGHGEDALGEHLGVDTNCPAATAACLLVEREAFDSIGGFSRGYRYGQEDVDLGLKLTASGREVVSSGRAVLFHHEFGTQKSVEDRDFMHINRAGNRRLLLERWGPQLHRELCLDRLGSDSFWSEKPAHIALTVVGKDEAGEDDEWHVARELGEALESRGWRVTYIQHQGRYYLPQDVDYLLVSLDSYDVSCISGVTTIAWIRDRTEHWVRQPWFEKFDVVLTTSDASARMVEQSTSKTSCFFPVATNPERFSPKPANPLYEADYVFTGDYRDGPSGLVDLLDVAPEETFMVFGRGWEGVPRLTRYARGPLPRGRLPQVYSSASLVIDAAENSTSPCGPVRPKVLDALVTGTLVITNREAGVRELFDGDFPTYDTRQELRENLDVLLGDETRRAELADRYQEIVLREHTFERRAEQRADLLRARAKSLGFCIKTNAPDRSAARYWEDFAHARAVQRQLERRGHPCVVQVLDEWDNLEGLEYDVAIHLKGPASYVPKPSQFNVLWDVGYSEPPTARECDRYDLVFVPSERRAMRLRAGTRTVVAVLEPATDPVTFFFPDPDPIHRCELVFVGGSREAKRGILQDLLPTDHDLVVWGTGWEGLVDDKHIVGRCLPNDQVRKAYSSASITLIDHQDEMREYGLVSHQIYDALACGALVISSSLPELSERFGDTVVTYDSPEELRRLIGHYLDSPKEREEKGKCGRKFVLAHHTFESQVEEMLKWVKEHTKEGEFRTHIHPLARAT